MKDKNGIEIKDDDVLFDGDTYWRYCVHQVDGVYLLSCEKGYCYETTPAHLSLFEVIGPFKGNEHLFEVINHEEEKKKETAL